MSIKPEDLRIGNWVHTDNGDGHVASIYRYATDEFKIGAVVPPLQKYEYKNPKVTGIPLTQEILLGKCGFEKVRDLTYALKKEPAHIVLIDFIKTYRVSLTGAFGMVAAQDIKYLHQLQNLFYFLTGEELKYEP